MIGGRPRRGALCGRDNPLGRCLHGGAGDPIFAPRPHLIKRACSAIGLKARKKIGQPVDPARGHGFRLVGPDRAADPNLGRCDGLLEIMGGKANPAFGQQKPRLSPHLAIEPRVGRGGFGPSALVHAAKDDQIG